MNLIERMAISGWFARVGPKIVPRMDRAAHRLTGGRFIPSALYLPVLMLTTTGRKSGQPRGPVPLATIPDHDGLLVVASNFGREHHPAWSENLLAQPKAHVEFRGQQFDVTARLLDSGEKAARWPKIVKRWPNFDRYGERSGRDLRVFLLEKA